MGQEAVEVSVRGKRWRNRERNWQRRPSRVVLRKLQGRCGVAAVVTVLWRRGGRRSSALDPYRRGACVWPANISLSPWWPDFGCQATRCNTAVWIDLCDALTCHHCTPPRQYTTRHATTRSHPHTYWPTVKGPRHCYCIYLKT